MIDWTPILSHAAPAGVVLSRITGIFILAPIVSHPAIPRQARALLALVLALAVYPLVRTLPEWSSPASSALDLTLWSVAPLMGMELLIGFVIGLFAIIPFVGVQLAGHTMGQQFGLAIAQAADAEMESNVSIVGIILFYMAIAIFIRIGGIEALFAVLLSSFDHVPPGGFRPSLGLIDVFTGALQSAFALALRIAAPILCLMFLQTIALGFISRTAPAFNILSLGFPIRVLLGMAIMVGSVYVIGETITEQLVDVISDLFFVVRPL